MTAAVKVIIVCLACRQRNRVIVGSTSKCGRCGHVISGPTTDTLDNFADRLNASSASESFGRMHFPQDYQVCSGCGVTFHINDSARHAACQKGK